MSFQECVRAAFVPEKLDKVVILNLLQTRFLLFTAEEKYSAVGTIGKKCLRLHAVTL